MERRREPRYPVWKPAALSELPCGADREPVTLTEISEGGFRLLSSVPLMAGEEILLAIDRSAIFGVVRCSVPVVEGLFSVAGRVVEVVSAKQNDWLAIVQNASARPPVGCVDNVIRPM